MLCAAGQELLTPPTTCPVLSATAPKQQIGKISDDGYHPKSNDPDDRRGHNCSGSAVKAAQ